MTTDPPWRPRSDARRLERRAGPAPAPGSGPRARKSRGPRPALVVVPSLAAFFTLLGGLATQMREGRDPGLRAGTSPAATHETPAPDPAPTVVTRSS